MLLGDAASPTPIEPRIGRALGDFVLRAYLANGAHGEVYLADQRGLGREAVIKIARGAGAERTQRFLREVRLAARLDHPYAAHVYAFGAEPDGLLWIAMERVHGATLAELIAERGALSIDRLVPLLERICEVVHTAHEQGIVHRDLKPANVMVVARAGRLLPKLLDFGIARAVSDADDDARIADEPAGDDATITQRGDIVGSPAFMAPEQWFDPAGVDRRTDVYALGALVYCALTGAPPFDGATPRDVARAHAQQPPPPLGGRVPPALDAVIARALAKRREDRYATALELAAAVRAAAGDAAPGVPALPAAVRDAMLGGAPAPIADALAAYDAARDAAGGLAALAVVVTAIVRWLAVIALAGRARHGEWSAEARALLIRLRAGPLSDAHWLALARAAIGAGSAALLPVPELADALADPALRDAVEPPSSPPTDVPAALAARLVIVERLLRALGLLLAGAVVVRRADRVERWTGTRRRRRAVAQLAEPSALALDTPVLLDADGAEILALAPFALVASPTRGADAELFLLDRGAPGGAVYVAFPDGYEHRDDPWLALGDALPAAGADAAAIDDHGPYRGLEPFRIGDAAWFFGRDAEADAAANRLRDRGVLAVVGPSGAGKSSFVLAGVVPRMSDRRTVVLRPGLRPDLALDAALGDAPAAGSLVVVDQLEELVTLVADPIARVRFADRLVALVAGGAHLAVTVRDDFLLRVVTIGGLHALLEPAVQLLATPTRDQLRRILVEPARRAGYVFEDERLVDAMVDSVADHPGALPLLSFTAARLWRERDRQLRQLTRRAHDALGGVAGALAGHADAVVNALGEARTATVRDVFRNLATAEGTRAALTRAELDQVVGSAAAEVVTRLVDARLLITSEDAAGDRVELVHEALLEAWPRLRRWRQDDAEVARLRDQLRAAARQWDERGRPHGLLWRGDALDDYRRWRPRYGGTLTGREDAFAGASLADAARSRRRRRWLYGGALGGLALAAIALLFVATQARRSRATAETSRKLAEDRATQLFVEHGRDALLADDGQRAYLFLREATQRGARDLGVATMLARAGRLVLSEQLAIQAASPIYAVAWRPDGTGFATAGADGVVELWASDGTRRARLSGHTAVVWSLAWSPDGKRLISAGDDTVPRLWDAEHGTLIAALRGHRAGDARTSRGNHGLAVSQDGAWIATSSWGGDVWLWDGETGAPRAQLDGHDGAANAVAFGADGASLLTTDQTSVRSWTLGAHPTQRAVIREPTGAVRWLGIAAGGLVIATAKAGPVRVIDPRAAHVVRTLAVHEGMRPPLVEGEQIITIGAGGELRAWRLDGARQWETAPGFAVSALALGRDRVAAGDNAGQLRIWERASGRATIVHADFHQKVWATAIKPDGTAVLAADFGGAIHLYAASGVDELSRDRVTAFTVGYVAGQLASIGATGIRRPGATTPLQDARDGALTADGRALVVTRDGRVRLYDRDGSDRGGPEEPGAPPIAISADGARAATAHADGSVTLWQVAGWQRLATVRGHRERLTTIAFDRSAARVVTCSDDRTARVWAVRDGAPIATLTGHDARVLSARFAGDTQLITASSDRTWRIWDLPSGRLARTFRNVDGEVLAVDLARDGRVATGGEGGVVVWSADGAVLARFLREAEVQALAWNADGTRLAVATGTATADDGDVVTLDVATAPADPAAVDCRLTMTLGADERLVDRTAPPSCPRLRE